MSRLKSLVSIKLSIFAFSHIWSCHTKGQDHPKGIIWIIMVVLEYPMLHSKFQGYQLVLETILNINKVYGHVKSAGKQMWHFHEKVKVNLKSSFEQSLSVLVYTMLHTKFPGHWFWEEFSPYMDVAVMSVMWWLSGFRESQLKLWTNRRRTDDTTHDGAWPLAQVS